MQPYCRHRAEKALEAHWQRSVSLKESTTLVTALMNPMSESSHSFLMENIGMHMAQASQIYSAHAPSTCHCEATILSDSLAA
ncbi:MAG: hypothetical protein WCD18_24510 [Thermosynechococcaceae cyanobacterium]